MITEDVTKQRQLEDHLRQQAARDPLTGLANYRRLAEVLDMEIKRSERTGREFALLLFDLAQVSGLSAPRGPASAENIKPGAAMKLIGGAGQRSY